MQHQGLQRIFTIVAGLWVGGFVTVAYLVTPILFSTLGDRQVAGIVAGNNDSIQNREHLLPLLRADLFGNDCSKTYGRIGYAR